MHDDRVVRRVTAPSSLALFVLLAWLVVATGAAHAQTTIVLDGVNDFEPGQCVAGGDFSTWCFASDASNFYIGLEHPDVSAGGNQHVVTLYVDTDPQAAPLTGAGSSSGVVYNTQQPGLPFNADVHVRWLADDSFEGVLAWDGAAWTSVATGLAITESNSTSFVEFSIPRADLGSPASVNVVGSIVFEAPGFESTFAFVPPTTSAGYDPDPVDFLSLALHPVSSVPSTGALGALSLAAAMTWLGLRSLRGIRRPA